MPSDRAWAEAASKRRDWSGLAATLRPDQSVALAMVQRAASPAGLQRLFGGMTDPEVEALVFDLDFWARRQQVPPKLTTSGVAWEVCVALAGRGFGKTWMGAAWTISKAKEAKNIGALIGPTAADVRDTMIRGSSGILALSPPWFTPKYEPSKRRVTWPNGVYAICYSADKYDRLRGPNTGWVWGDEPCTWKHEMAALDQIRLFNRIGTKNDPPQALLTGTPRPLKKLEELIHEATTVLVTGSSLANAANLAPTTVANMRALAGSRWGKQEILGLLLMDVPGAIFGGAKWIRIEVPDGASLEEFRVAYAKTQDRCIVSVDPAPTSETGADETGIEVMGVKESVLVDSNNIPLKRVTVIEDGSLRGSPREWATRAIELYIRYGCDALVVEINSGGEMVTMTIETVAREMGVHVNVEPVRATSAKSKRAEPVSALAETGRIGFVGLCKGHDTSMEQCEACGFKRLMKQLEKFTGMNGRRDDRADAMCWGVHHLVFADQFFAV